MAEGIADLSQDTWNNEVVDSKGLVLVYFWSPWCGHCKMFAPTVDEVAQKYAGRMKFAKLNCDSNMGLAKECQIMGTPTLSFYKDGTQIDRIVGAIPRPQLEAKLDALLGGAS